VLEAISKALSDQRPPIGPSDWSISCARTQAAVGRVALARLTIRLHTDRQKLKSWDFEEIERKVRTLAGLQASVAHHTSTFGAGLDIPEDPVISVSLITTPAGTSQDETPTPNAEAAELLNPRPTEPYDLDLDPATDLASLDKPACRINGSRRKRSPRGRQWAFAV